MISLLEFLDIVSDLHYVSHKLVTHDEVCTAWLMSTKNMQFAAAKTCILDTANDIFRILNLRFRTVFDCHFFGALEDYCFHGS